MVVTPNELFRRAYNVVQLNFNPADVTVERVDNNLIFKLADGQEVIIEDFFVTDGEALPALAFLDGTKVESKDFLLALDANMDISTAAGPTAAAPGSGGTNYEDYSGELLGGVDTLGTLGTDQWGNGASTLRVDDFVADDSTPIVIPTVIAMNMTLVVLYLLLTMMGSIPFPLKA